MHKIKVLFIIILIVCITTTVFAVEIEDEYDEIDYIRLENEIESAKKDVDPEINSKYAVVFDRASQTIIYGKEENEEVPMASTTKIMTT